MIRRKKLVIDIYDGEIVLVSLYCFVCFIFDFEVGMILFLFCLKIKMVFLRGLMVYKYCNMELR